MNPSRTLVTTAVALAVLATFGCAADAPRAAAPAPEVIMVPEPVAVVTPMQSYPVLVQVEPGPQAVVQSEPPQTMAAADMSTERAPRADRN